MTSPLHKVPLGLLELFRLKTLGRAPNEFSDTVVPTVDVIEAYAASEMNSSGGGPTVGAINGVNGLQQFTVFTPFHWLWALGGALTVGAAAGTFVTWEVGLLVPSTNTLVAIGSGELRPIGAGTTIRFGLPLPRPLCLKAGSAWYAGVHGDAAGADHSLIVAGLVVPGATLN